jgi:hypothetical protein
MNLVVPNLGMVRDAKIIANSFYDSKDPGVLTQDLLLIELPGKTFIDVSWFPEHDPSGAYTITVFRGYEQIADAEAKTVPDALSIVEGLALRYSAPVANVSCSEAKVVFDSMHPVEGSAHGYSMPVVNVSCSAVQTITYQAAA